MRYFLYGYYGHVNFGDDLLLHALIEGIGSRDPDARFNIYSFDAVPGLAGDPRVQFTGLARLTQSMRRRPWRLPVYLMSFARWLARSDVLAIGGGTLFIDKGRINASLLLLYGGVLMAQVMGRRIIVLGVGVDRLTHPVTRWLTRRIFGAAEFVAVREAHALPYVGHRAAESTKISADLVLTLDLGALPPRRARARQVIGLCFIDYFRALGLPQRDHDAYATAIFRFVDDNRASHDFACITFQRGVGQRDDWIVPEWRKKYPDFPVMDVDSIDGARAAIAEVDIIVTTRFHLGLLGIIWKKRVLVIDHELKMASLIGDFGLPGLSLAEFMSGPGIDLDRVMAGYDSTAVAKELAAQRARAALNFAWLPPPTTAG